MRRALQHGSAALSRVLAPFPDTGVWTVADEVFSDPSKAHHMSDSSGSRRVGVSIAMLAAPNVEGNNAARQLPLFQLLKKQ